MPRKGRARLRALADLLRERHPEIDATSAIARGQVLADRRIVTNPASLVRGDASISIRDPGDEALRGETKLAAALHAFAVPVTGRIALDIGAAAGGFTRVLLGSGATRVYAVDVGYGQLLGSLRQHPAVVNLERTNLAQLGPRIVPDTVDVVTADLSYISLAQAVPQLNGRVKLAADADLLVVIKPQFELALSEPPTEAWQLGQAVERASAGIDQAGWTVRGTLESPSRGRRGSPEFLLHARRCAG
jgi:23S rRNA (cytidine1920-2'-O)/16S rRNA (cytidine1409-2'-O)-methyltransferase